MRHQFFTCLLVLAIIFSVGWATSRNSTPVVPGETSFKEADIDVAVNFDAQRANFTIIYRTKQRDSDQKPPEAFLTMRDAEGKPVVSVPVSPEFFGDGPHYRFTVARDYCNKSSLVLAPRDRAEDRPPSGLSFTIDLGKFERARAATEASSRPTTVSALRSGSGLLPMPDLKEAMADAAGAALVEVKDLKEVDARPGDGDLYVQVKLSPVKSSGLFVPSLHITKEEGGMRLPDNAMKCAPYVAPLKHDSLEKGKRYWILFSSQIDDKYHQGIVAFWPAETPKVSGWLEEAVQKDHYLWQPQISRATGLTIGYLLEPDRNRWRIRVSKEGDVLWEKIIEGLPPGISWRPWIRGFTAETGGPQLALVLDVQTERLSAPDKETGDPKAPTEGQMEYVFDALTGRLLVETFGSAATPRWQRSYDSKTGRLVALDIFTMNPDISPPKDESLRRESRRYDKDTGKLVGTRFFHYSHTDRGGGWVPVPGDGPTTQQGKPN